MALTISQNTPKTEPVERSVAEVDRRMTALEASVTQTAQRVARLERTANIRSMFISTVTALIGRIQSVFARCSAAASWVTARSLPGISLKR